MTIKIRGTLGNTRYLLTVGEPYSRLERADAHGGMKDLPFPTQMLHDLIRAMEHQKAVALAPRLPETASIEEE